MNRRRVLALPVRLPIVSFAIDHPEHGLLLIDSGTRPGPGVSKSPEGTVREQVDGDPTAIVMTHLHLDHTAGLRDFPGTRLIMDRREWDAFKGPRPALHGYVPGHLREANHEIELLDLDGRHDLFGDGTVQLVPTPGHTLGHLSAVVRTASGDVLVCGDAIYVHDNLKPGNEPLVCEDRDAWRRSVRELNALIEDAAVVIPGHDAHAWEALKPAY